MLYKQSHLRDHLDGHILVSPKVHSFLHIKIPFFSEHKLRSLLHFPEVLKCTIQSNTDYFIWNVTRQLGRGKMLLLCIIFTGIPCRNRDHRWADGLLKRRGFAMPPKDPVWIQQVSKVKLEQGMFWRETTPPMQKLPNLSGDLPWIAVMTRVKKRIWMNDLRP